ncbi:S-adenosyl-L-methionine-dependent methyltransferase [Suillus subalutaceus]|uniref:S-adenosyl-L-methionine-dependent methyltransferase n=1 Tax=Suillus subalutaceus TaxID=48586 RepID=UPI001B85C498|nr:S-adenosyl-L-methionine-dependent methyltransferase [Suillus subalutaceus]KAG1846055.1 S-adenosyl-L-methionine-dependent methyltransferase [Suillus subalutaceus]
MTELNEVKVEALLGIINSSAREAMAEYKNTGHGVLVLEGACDQLNTILAPSQYTVFNFVNDYDCACTDVAVQSRIADVLDKYPEGLGVDALADAVNLDKIKTARILRVLALRGCFKEVKRDVFANTRLSLILKSTNNVWCHLQHHQQFPKYAAVLYETMIDQEFAKSDKDEARDIILGTMYPLVDVGSGIGAMSIPLAKMFPHLRITNQDLPETIVQSRNLSPDIRSTPNGQVILIFDQAWEKNAPEALLDGRVEFVPVNFLEESPVVGKDVYYLRNIVHDWPDDESRVILHNIRKVMEPNSQVLIHECVLLRTSEGPDVGANGFSKDHKAPEPTLLNFGSHTSYHLDMTMASVGLVLTQIYDPVGTMVLEFRIAQD